MPEGDILFHAGDFTTLGMESEIEHFNEFLGGLNFKHKLVIAGNHELTLDEENQVALMERVPLHLFLLNSF